MVKKDKLYQRIINNRKNVRFSDFISVVEAFGFLLDRVKGSHQVYKHPDIADALLVLQPDKNQQAKPYQIKQFLKLVEEHDLRMGTIAKDDRDDA